MPSKLARFCYFSSNVQFNMAASIKKADIAQYQIDSLSTMLYILLVKSNDQDYYKSDKQIVIHVG